MNNDDHYSYSMFGFNLLLKGVTGIDPKQCNFPVFETEHGLVGEPIASQLFLTGQYKGQSYDPKYNGPVTRLCNDAALFKGDIHCTAKGITPVEYMGVRFVMTIKTNEAEKLGLARGDKLPDDWPETIRIE